MGFDTTKAFRVANPQRLERVGIQTTYKIQLRAWRYPSSCLFSQCVGVGLRYAHKPQGNQPFTLKSGE